MTQKHKNHRTLFIESTDAPVKRDEVLKILREHKAILAERFGIAEISIFGSFARDEAAEDSDLDVLVRFEGPAHWRRFFDAQFYIEDLLGRPVDLATEKMVRPEIRPYVEREIVHV